GRDDALERRIAEPHHLLRAIERLDLAVGRDAGDKQVDAVGPDVQSSDLHGLTVIVSPCRSVGSGCVALSIPIARTRTDSSPSAARSTPSWCWSPTDRASSRGRRTRSSPGGRPTRAP